MRSSTAVRPGHSGTFHKRLERYSASGWACQNLEALKGSPPITDYSTYDRNGSAPGGPSFARYGPPRDMCCWGAATVTSYGPSFSAKKKGTKGSIELQSHCGQGGATVVRVSR